MARPSPVHERTSALCHSMLWKEWNGYAAVRAYNAHSEAEYFAIRNKVGVIDVSPLCKVDVTGPDAGVLLSRVFSRDAHHQGMRRVTYGVLVDPWGKVLDDGTCARIGEEHYRLCTSDRWLSWLGRYSRGLQVRLEDTTERLACLAVQGPLARELLGSLVDFPIGRMPFFRMRNTRIGGIEGQISRTGYTGDLGYELWVSRGDAIALWDTLAEAGGPTHLTPFGLDALDVARIEAGFILPGVDYNAAHTAMIESRKSTPHELGLGRCVDLEREVTFVGQEAVEAELVRGVAWDLVGLEIDWEELEGLYASVGLPPHLAPVACRDPVPVYAADGRTQVGQVTSKTWSPTLKRSLALASVRAPFAAVGTKLRVEHTVEFVRRTVSATVVPRTFFDPPRKRDTIQRSQGTA